MEKDPRRGLSFLVERIGDLKEALAGAAVPAPRTNSSTGAMLRTGRGGRAG